MSLLQGISQFTEELNKRSIPFGIIGGLAVFAYGGERTTFDVDFLIDGQHRDSVKDAAQGLGLKIVNENPEVIQFGDKVQIDIIFANRPQTKAMLSRLRKVGLFPYPVVSPEDLIGLKIQGFVGDRSREFRDKHDIQTIINNVENLDLNKIKEYADIFKVWKEIEEIKNRS